MGDHPIQFDDWIVQKMQNKKELFLENYKIFLVSFKVPRFEDYLYNFHILNMFHFTLVMIEGVDGF